MQPPHDDNESDAPLPRRPHPPKGDGLRLDPEDDAILRDIWLELAAQRKAQAQNPPPPDADGA